MNANGIKLKADRLYKRFVDGGLILGCVRRMCHRKELLTINKYKNGRIYRQTE
jgi:hypothetical protein